MKRNYIIATTAVVLLAVIGFYVTNNNTEITGEGDTSSEETKSIEGLEVGESMQQNGYTIERLPDGEESTLVPPNLNREIPTIAPGLNAAAHAQVVSNSNDVIALLKSGTGSFDEWLKLGVYRDVLGDYVGAEEVWIYMTLRYTDDWRAFTNLGDLYSSHLLNLEKAEWYTVKAIALQPKVTELYRDLFDIRVRRGNNEGAVQALKDGIAAEPKAIDLYILLARHYKEGGNSVQAAEYYEHAIALAQAEGNVSLVEELKIEKEQS